MEENAGFEIAMFKGMIFNGSWQLIDDDFKCNAPLWPWLDFAKEYAKRKLDVGKNLALYTKWYIDHYGEAMAELLDDLLKKQDMDCITSFDNWSEIAENRDNYLRLLNI